MTQPGSTVQHDLLDQVGKVVARAGMADDEGERCIASQHDEVARMPGQAPGAGSPGKRDGERLVDGDAIGDLQDQSVGEPSGVESDEVLAGEAGDAPQMAPDDVVSLLDGTGQRHQLDAVGQGTSALHPAAVDENRRCVIPDVRRVRRLRRQIPG